MSRVFTMAFVEPPKAPIKPLCAARQKREGKYRERCKLPDNHPPPHVWEAVK